MSKIWLFIVAAVLLLSMRLFSGAENAPYGGTWELDYNAKQKTLQMQLYRKGSSNGFNITLESLRGLTLEMILSDSRSVTFQLVREAGTFHCTGSFKNGEGRGQFDFQPDSTYPSRMAQLGYSGITGKQQYLLATLDVSTRFVRDLRDVGYIEKDLERVIEMRIHGATAEYVRSLQSLGYKNIPSEKLVEMRIHGVNAGFIQKMKEAGYSDLPENKLVEFRIHGVSPERVAEFRKLGYERLSANKLVEFQIHDVTPEFIRELRELGYNNVSERDLVSMRIHNVSPSFIRRVHENRQTKPDVDDLISMKIHGRD